MKQLQSVKNGAVVGLRDSTRVSPRLVENVYLLGGFCILYSLRLSSQIFHFFRAHQLVFARISAGTRTIFMVRAGLGSTVEWDRWCRAKHDSGVPMMGRTLSAKFARAVGLIPGKILSFGWTPS